MLNSANGFPVEVVYANNIEKMASFGRVGSQLPVPDMIVTNTLWDVYLPADVSYQSLKTNMSVTHHNSQVRPKITTGNLINGKDHAQPLRVQVPSRGTHYQFEKLYANQSKNLATFSLEYSSSLGNRTGQIMSGVGVVIIWLGILLLRSPRSTRVITVISAAIFIGILLVFIASSHMKADLTLAFTLALIGGLGFGFTLAGKKISDWRNSRYEEDYE